MQKSILLLFLINGRVIEQLEGEEIAPSTIENMKTNLALEHGVSFGEVVTETKSIDIFSPEESMFWAVGIDGVLKARYTRNSPYYSVKGLRPALDITKEELNYEFLDLIHKKDYIKAFTFVS